MNKYYLTTPHLLRQCRAAHRPRLHHHRRRHHQALQAHAGLPGGADHRHATSTASTWSAPPQRAGKTPKEFCRRDLGGVPAAMADAGPATSITSSAPPTRSTPGGQRSVQSLPRRTAISTRVVHRPILHLRQLYVNDAKPGDPCPDCGRPTETVTEENYFFKLSAFTERLLELYEAQPGFHPARDAPQRSAVVRAAGPDGSVHHAAPIIKWGIPVEGEAPHVFYVWFDALIAYMTRGRRSAGPLARRPAPDRQGDCALPRGLLAGVSDGRGPAAAQEDFRARLAAVRREQDEQVARQHRARGADPAR